MLEAHEVSYEVRGRRLLDRVGLAVVPARITVVVGPNGAGKSTLLRVLSRELAPTEGRVTLDGADIATAGAAALSARRAVVPQATSLTFPFTVLEVVMLGATVPGFHLDDTRARTEAHRALARVGLATFATRLYTELSGGERQRVHIARALCQLAAARRPADVPGILLLDEPTASLDVAHQLIALRELRQLASDGHAVFLILHDLNLAAAHADHLVLMSQGRIAAAGTPGELFEDDLLSRVFGCPIRANRTPAPDIPFVLPHAHAAPANPP